MARFLVTGGAGYIGSTTSKQLAAAGHAVTVYDNLSTGHAEFVKWGDLVRGDIRDTDLLRETLRSRDIEGVVHFAASAYVGVSMVDPGAYFDNNVVGALSLLKAMRDAGTNVLVVSSTCAVYGQPETLPIVEGTPKAPLNPYGASKLFMERMCADFEVAHGIRTSALRYFNACGTEPELECGERHDPEPHLIPRVLMAAEGEIGALRIFGTDYPTPDGTCIRDYIHVVDLAAAHIKALDYLLNGGASLACNLGTGTGVSVKQIVEAAGRVTGRPIPVENHPRRSGDPAQLVAGPDLARKVLKWSPQCSDIDTVLDSAWQWFRRERRSLSA